MPYTVVLSNPVYTGIENSWNWDNAKYSSGQISGAVSQAWQALGPAQGGEVNIGGSVLGSSTNLYPVTVTVAGRPCTVVR